MKRGLVLMALVSLFATVCLPAFAAEKGLTSAEKSFIKDAASGGAMEVELGQAAVKNAMSQDVKDFGQRMVTDHGKANEELKTLVGKKQVQVPTELERKHKSKVEKLSKLSGEEFDKKYMKAMVKDHVKDVADFKKASKKAKDPELKAWIDKTLPVLEQHLQQAKDVAQKLGVKTK